MTPLTITDGMAPRLPAVAGESAPRWNPRYLAYCHAHGVSSPEHMLELDSERWPGGRMCGYLLWNGRQWLNWAQKVGHPRARDPFAPLWSEDQVSFDAYLAEQYPPPQLTADAA